MTEQPPYHVEPVEADEGYPTARLSTRDKAIIAGCAVLALLLIALWIVQGMHVGPWIKL